MAVTGFLLFLFVIGHMVGNLQIFLGREQLNAYAHFLQSTPELLWTVRLGLLVIVLIHIWMAVRLAGENKAARGIGYEEYVPMGASYASRTMLMSGIIVGVFIVYHLLHFTVLVEAINLTGEDFAVFHDEEGRHDVYRMMILGFSNVWVSIFYMVGVGLLCLHLSHGGGSMFQSIGWKNRYYGRLLDRLAVVVAVILFLGYISIPVAVLADERLHLIQIFE